MGTKIGIFGDSTTLLGDLYNYVNTLEANLTAITTAASGVDPHLTAGDMGARITATDTILGTVQTSLDGMKTQVESVISLLEKADSYNITYSFALYGTVMGMSLISLIAIILIKCFNMITCRYLLYFICILSFFISAFLFLFAIALSVGMSTTYYSCVYLADTFTSPSSFTNMVNNIIGTQHSSISTYFSECFGGTN